MRIVQFIILTFDVNPKVLNFTDKLKTASGKYMINMVTLSLPFAVSVILISLDASVKKTPNKYSLIIPVENKNTFN